MFLKNGGAGRKESMFEKIYIGIMVIIAIAATIFSWRMENGGFGKKNDFDQEVDERKE